MRYVSAYAYVRFPTLWPRNAKVGTRGVESRIRRKCVGAPGVWWASGIFFAARLAELSVQGLGFRVQGLSLQYCIPGRA